MSITDLVPDCAVLLQLEPAEVGAVMSEYLNRLPPNERWKFTFAHFREDRLAAYPPAQRSVAARAFAEGWNWLTREGLIVPDPDDNYAMWYFISRRGAKLSTREHVAAYARASVLPKQLLHPVVQAKSESAFSRGEYDTAVFQAFKEFEIQVRSAAGLGENEFGTDLMRKAFHDSTGALTDMALPISERQALAHLCAGAIGSYKNPHSHRKVAIDAEQATEMLILASHLMRIVDGRRTRRDA